MARIVPLLLTGGLLISPVPSLGQGPSKDAVIDRIMKAYGGREAIGSVGAYRMEGTVGVSMPGASMDAPFTRVFKRPDALSVTIGYRTGAERRILNGHRGWRGLRGEAAEAVTGFLYDSMVLQAARAAIPWILDERRDTVRLLSPAEGAGDRTVLAVPLGPGLTFRATIDPATGLVTVSEGTLIGPQMATGFRTEYGDFRPVGGVIFPFREENYASGQRTGTTRIEAIEVNPKLSGAEFTP